MATDALPPAPPAAWRLRPLLDAGWRAAAYCLHPRVIVLSLLPVLGMAVLALALGYFFWDDAVAVVRTGFDDVSFIDGVLGWFEALGWGSVRTALAPLVVVFAAMPVIVIVALLVVSLAVAPAVVSLVSARRFPGLERKHGGSTWGGALRALGATLVAVLALAVSLPLWFVPPLALVIPPLIWGWLTYRVMAYDVLALHASQEERQALLQTHRRALLGIGIVTGCLGAAPSVVWASGALFLALAPVLVAVAVWIYTLVFAFSALWFAHYALEALHTLRAASLVPAPVNIPPVNAPLP